MSEKEMFGPYRVLIGNAAEIRFQAMSADPARASGTSFLMQTRDDPHLAYLGPDDKNLAERLFSMHQISMATGRLWVCRFNGYDQEPTELWHNEEFKTLLRLAEDQGLGFLLEVSEPPSPFVIFDSDPRKFFTGLGLFCFVHCVPSLDITQFSWTNRELFQWWAEQYKKCQDSMGRGHQGPHCN